MTLPIADKTRKEIRQMVGYNLGEILVSAATATGTNATILDTQGLAFGGTDDYKGREVIMISGTTANVGSTRRVTAFNATSKTLTISPTLTSATAAADGYELHEDHLVAEINDKINQAIVAATSKLVLKIKEDHSLVKLANIYEYAVPSGFVAIHSVEYVYNTLIDYQLESCDTVWSELVDGNVTATADTDEYKEGSGSLKLVVADACSAGDILATEAITSIDLNDCDELLVWVFSTVALSAGDLQVLLGNTAECASALESLNIPATTANTWTRHVISLANPASDVAIISVGIKMVTDKGAFTVRVDDIRAQKAKSRVWVRLSPDVWSIVQASTNLLKLHPHGYSVIGNNELMRLTGYQIPAELSADSTTCDIDPDYVVAMATALLLASKARGREVDIDERLRRSDWWMARANDLLSRCKTPLAMNTRWVS